MKKGINAWCFTNGTTMEDAFRLAKEAGFDGLEINMSENKGEVTDECELTTDMDATGYERIKALSVKYDLPITSISTSLHWSYPLTSNDLKTAECGKEVVRKMIDAAAYLGCGAILVVPGLVTEDVSYDTAYGRSQKAFNELKDYAESKKIVIGVENVWNKFLLSPLEARRFIDEINSEYVKFYFDAGNVLQFSYPQHWVRILENRIVRVHIKDFDTKIGNISGFKNLMHGDMNWSALLEALNDVGYDGYLTAELSPYKYGENKLIFDTSKALDCIFSMK